MRRRVEQVREVKGRWTGWSLGVQAVLLCVVMALVTSCGNGPGPSRGKSSNPVSSKRTAATVLRNLRSKHTQPVAPMARTRVIKATVKARSGPAPAISCDEAVYNFGKMVNTKEVNHTFVLKNVGHAPLVIAGASPSCGCTVVKLGKKKVAPGDSTEVKAQLSLTEKMGPIVKTIGVRSNDPSNPLLMLTLKGTAVAYIEAHPSRVSWSVLSKNEKLVKPVEIVAGVPDVTFKITSVESSSPEVSTRVVTVEPGKKYRLMVSTVPPLSEGILSALLRVHTNRRDFPEVPVSVFARVAGPLDIAPPYINVPSPSAMAVPVRRFIRLAPGTVKHFKVLAVKTPFPEITAKVDSQRGSNIVVIELDHVPPSAKMNGKSLLIKTDAPGRKEIRIPFRVQVWPLAPIRRPPGPRPTQTGTVARAHMGGLVVRPGGMPPPPPKAQSPSPTSR